MDDKIVRVDVKTSAKDAIRTMIQDDVWSVVVTKDGKYVGVMTERDFLRRCIIPGLDPDKTPVEKVMSSPLITIKSDAPLGEALKLMAVKNVRRLYVTEDGKIVGRVTQTGLMRKTLEIFLALSSI